MTTSSLSMESICHARANEQLADLREYQRKLAQANLSESEREDLEQEVRPLEIEPLYQLRILLSWGGPEDGFVLTFKAKDYTLQGGHYYYADWYSYAQENLSIADAQMVCEVYLGDDPRSFL